MVFKATFNKFQWYRGGQFNGGGNWNTKRKPPTCANHMQILSHSVISSTHTNERDSNSQL